MGFVIQKRKQETPMNIYKLATIATLAFVLAGGSALARPNFVQTPAQIAADLSHPGNSTYAPSNK